MLAIHETPLTTVLDRANKDSVNLYAESLCKRLGHEATGPARLVGKTAPLPSASFSSRSASAKPSSSSTTAAACRSRTRSAPRRSTKILAYKFHSPNRDVFRASLAVAGVDGTMEDRFRGSDLRGRVFAKSGYVANVRALSGYLHASDGQWYAFSILMNRVPDAAAVKTDPGEDRQGDRHACGEPGQQAMISREPANGSMTGAATLRRLMQSRHWHMRRCLRRSYEE